MLQNLEDSGGGRVHTALCTYWRRRMKVCHAGIALEGNEGMPNTDGEFAGQKTMWPGAQCAQCQGDRSSHE